MQCRPEWALVLGESSPPCVATVARPWRLKRLLRLAHARVSVAVIRSNTDTSGMEWGPTLLAVAGR